MLQHSREDFGVISDDASSCHRNDHSSKDSSRASCRGNNGKTLNIKNPA